ncbi:CHAT domain-containing protein [Microcoleus sp. FACHB-53]|nr:CHAT domain-containing protein [Microcoleus sp. FACHB-53]
MKSYRVGLTALVTFLATVSTPLIVASVAVFSPPSTSVQAQDTRKTSADQLIQQGITQYQQGKLDAAIQSWQQALKIYQQLKERQGEATALGNLGAAYLATGNYKQAIASLQPLIPITQALSDRNGEARALGNLGIAYKGMGDYEKAIASHQQALALMQQLKNRQGEGQILGNLGNAYEGLGNYDKAIASYQQSLTIAQEVKDRIGEGAALGNLGAIYANQGKYDEAIKTYQQSLAIAQAVDDKAGQANTLNNLGIASQVKGDTAKAIDYYNQGLTLARAIGDRQLEARTLGGLGLTYEDQRDFPKAIAHQQQTLKIAQTMGDRQLEAMAFNNLGHALFSANNLPEAEKQLRQALTAFESLRPGLTDADNVSVFDTQVFSYNLLQQILIAAKKPEAALEISERGRARAFVELLGQRLSPQAAQNYKTKAQPPTIQQIQQIAKTQKATVVEYAIIPDDDFKFQGKLRGPSSKLFIWVVQPTGQVAFRQVDLKNLKPVPGQAKSNAPTSLEDLVRASRNLEGPYAQRSESVRKQLYQLLIQPIAEFLPKDPTERVVFIPHETLFLLPFPALQNASGQYLIEKHTILTAPAIQVLELTHQQRKNQASQNAEQLQGKNALIVGNPKMPADLEPLPAAEQEAIEIAKLLNTQAITGERATKTSVVQQMSKARLMHFATHGILDDIKKLGVPGAIALAPSQGDEGFLTSGEILNLKLNADLVVLSACNTGRGKITGDGVIGLSRSLISAGTPSVIVSLWSVPDAPTALLMTELYRNLQQNPDKAQALRQAMLTTMKQQPNPYNWAAFTLVGEAD